MKTLDAVIRAKNRLEWTRRGGTPLKREDRLATSVHECSHLLYGQAVGRPTPLFVTCERHEYLGREHLGRVHSQEPFSHLPLLCIWLTLIGDAGEHFVLYPRTTLTPYDETLLPWNGRISSGDADNLRDLLEKTGVPYSWPIINRRYRCARGLALMLWPAIADLAAKLCAAGTLNRDEINSYLLPYQTKIEEVGTAVYCTVTHMVGTKVWEGSDEFVQTWAARCAQHVQRSAA